ncbi:VCBS repeat domain-containing M23 family metallopeptidase [Erysipelothrix rhusiopathiae]|nr:VCBS repeat domain-containing M23 family metallopeptidase [Erysipelothrix rhusiopathiae]
MKKTTVFISILVLIIYSNLTIAYASNESSLFQDNPFFSFDTSSNEIYDLDKETTTDEFSNFFAYQADFAFIDIDGVSYQGQIRNNTTVEISFKGIVDKSKIVGLESDDIYDKDQLSYNARKSSHNGTNYSLPIDYENLLNNVVCGYGRYEDCGVGLAGNHNGTDFGWTGINGELVYSVGSGIVSSVVTHCSDYEWECGGGWGNYVSINHDSDSTKTLYAHMQRGSINVSKNQYIKQASPIGRVGTTGASQAPHLHFEVYPNKEVFNRTNPIPYLVGQPTPSTFLKPQPTKNNSGSRFVSGDFDGDGNDEIIAMYNYGKHKMKLQLFEVDASNNIDWVSTWFTADSYNTEGVDGRMVASDVNGDGKDDIVVMYDYGNGKMEIHSFISNGNKFIFKGSKTWFSTDKYDPKNISNRFVSGDFNGDGLGDVASIYAFPDNSIKVHVFLSDGTKFSSKNWYETSKYDGNKLGGRVVSGDFNGDRKSDIAMVYDYGSGRMQIHVLTSEGNSFKFSRQFEDKSYNANSIKGKLMSIDQNNDGKDDLVFIYDYGNNKVKYHSFLSSSGSFPGWSTMYKNDDFSLKGMGSRNVIGKFNNKKQMYIMYDYGSSVTRILNWELSGTKLNYLGRQWHKTEYDASKV